MNFQYPGILIVLLFSACSLSRSVQDGRTAYEQKQYARAIDMLEAEIANISDKAEYAATSYILGDSYKHINDSDNSLKWFIEAAKNDYGPEAYWEMAFALKKQERYEDAILSFRRLEKMTDRTNDIRNEIEKCRQARIWTDEQGDHQYILEALTLNSKESDYAPFILSGKYLVFTSDRTEQIDGEIYQWTGNSFSNLFITEIGDYEVEPFNDIINTIHNEGTACFSMNSEEMFFTRCFSEVGDSYCRILRSELINGQWTEGEEVFAMKRRVNYGDPVLIENDGVLVFTSDDPTGIGGHDLYYSVREEDGSWSEPELMPTYLNSIGEERFPTWNDGYLYYSSDFFAGLGGLDIFKTRLNEDGSWTQPENLKAPVNSSEDDYSFVKRSAAFYPENVRLQAFFTSTRGIYGNDDIYSLMELIPEDEIAVEDTVTLVEEETAKESKDFFIKLQVTEKIYALKDNPNSYVVGNKKVSGASLKVEFGNREDIFTTDENGEIILPLDTLTNYTALAGKQGYLNDKEIFEASNMSFSDIENGHVFLINMEIEKIFEGVEVILENIYYDFEEWFIREDAKPSLDLLIEVLDNNPAIKIQLSSHTDCRGDLDFNQDLSQKRAAAAIDYIREKGNVDPNRLSAVGYGESKLEIDCECSSCTEDEHQINRRTTFTIIGKE